jgi:general stress protein YciG
MSSKQQKDSSQKSSSDRSGDRRGFAGMDPERQREIAAKGGRNSHGGHGGSDFSDDSSDRSSKGGRESYKNDPDR